MNPPSGPCTEWIETLLEVPAIVCKTFGKRAAVASNYSFRARACGRCHVLVPFGSPPVGPLGRARGLEI